MGISLRRHPHALALAAAIVLASLALLHFAARSGADQPTGFSALPLLDQAGARHSLDAWRDKIVVLDFIYTSCGDVCPLKTAQLANVQARLDPDLRGRIQFVSLSVDPEHDDPAALRAYAARTGADLSDWSFLTGDLDDVARVAAAFDAAPQAGGDVPSHITTIRLLDHGLQVVQRWNGEPVEEARLAHAIQDLAGAAPKQP